METLIAHPKNEELSIALKAVMKVLKIDFEIKERIYNPEFLTKIKKVQDQIKADKDVKIAAEDLWK